MSAAEDFFEDDPIQRDRYGRPMLLPKGSKERVPYTRASTLSGYITDFTGLHIWEKRLLAKGLGEREDLAALVCSLPPLTGDKKADRVTNKQLDEVIDLALEVGGCHVKANYGTAIHAFTDPENDRPVPERMVGDVESFKKLGLDIVSTEVFCANDDLMCAGSFDHLISRRELGIVVGDKKTGQFKPHEAAIQLAVYANSDGYDPETDTRFDLGVTNREVGLLLHIPAGEKRTDIYKLDLVAGLQAARVAAWVREWRTRKDISAAYETTPVFVPPWEVAS